jgi:glycosyltransferase involved in cell wall biosynthesis
LSARARGTEHQVLSLLPPHPAAQARACSEGLTMRPATEFYRAAGNTDILHVHFWNSPDLYSALEFELPAARIAVTCHVGGSTAPQILTREVVELADVVLVTSRLTLERAGEALRAKAIHAPDAADFGRLAGAVHVPHTTFNIGYIGTVDFVKMHPRYVAMHAAIDIPEARIIVCGHGAASTALAHQISALGVADRFELRGYVEDIAPILSTLDVFGYPLCVDTYAATELVLQEAMYAGLPCIIFPHGGAAETITEGKTGFVVDSEAQYVERIAYLYHRPDELARMSAAAKTHARDCLGAKHFAPLVDDAYDRLMAAPRRARPPLAQLRGADAFLRSLGEMGGAFRSSQSAEPAVAMVADKTISRASPALASAGGGGVLHYRRNYPNDPMLRLWAGLIMLGHKRWALATAEFKAATELGLAGSRGLLYLSRAARAAGNGRLADEALLRLEDDYQ